MHKMSLKRILVASLVCLPTVAPAGLAQSGAKGTDQKNYKLSMEKIKAASALATPWRLGPGRRIVLSYADQNICFDSTGTPGGALVRGRQSHGDSDDRSEEHTSELQSLRH